jgi:hypothetical protein
MSTLATDAIEAAEPSAVVRGILVKPAGAADLHVQFAYAYTFALPGHGVHLDPDAVAHLLGSRRLQLHRLHDGEVLLTVADASGPRPGAVDIVARKPR